MNYPGISERVKSIVIDQIAIVFLLLAVSSLVEAYPDMALWIKIVLFVLIFFLYDPLFTSLIGGTIGHYVVGVRVRKYSDESRNISFLLAIVRFVVKYILGIISFLSLSFGNGNQAIHDLAVGSVVVYKKK